MRITPDRIKIVREYYSLTPEKAAELMGLHPAVFRLAENGERNISKADFERFVLSARANRTKEENIMTKKAAITKEMVANYVAANPNIDIKQIGDHFKVSYQVARKVVLDAMYDGLVERKERGGAGATTFLFFVPPPKAKGPVTIKRKADETPTQEVKSAPVVEAKPEPIPVAPVESPVSASLANIATGGEYKAFVDLLAKPIAGVVAEAVLPGIASRTTEMVIEKVLTDLPSLVVIDLIKRCRNINIDPMINSTKSLIEELVKPQKIRVCISGLSASDEAKLRSEFEKEFTLKFAPLIDIDGVVRSAEYVDHVILLTGRPNTDVAHAALKAKGIAPILVSGSVANVADRLTDLYLESTEVSA